MTGHRWREMRIKISPTFTSGKMKGMFPLVEECAKNFQNYLSEHQGENIDIKVCFLYLENLHLFFSL
jgi:cytochrome P450 family 6